MIDRSHIDACFAADYADARRRFHAAVERLGAPVLSYPAPETGPAGEELAADVAWFGPKDAGKVMVLVSATHGVEGFCGAGCQMDYLRMGGPARLPDDTAALLIHALNPYGFAWLRRVTQENVDLNRNGIDFAQAPPENPGYLELRDALAPKVLAGPEYDALQAKIRQFRETRGETAFRIARGAGQYVDPKGIHFGGFGPTWSRRTLETIIGEFKLTARRQVAVIDYHTGLGPYGYGEPICGNRPEEAGRDRGRAWYGESMTEPLLGTSTSVVIPGLMQYVWRRILGADPFTFIALEFGTFPRAEIERATEAEAWLEAQSDIPHDDPRSVSIKARFRRAYYPDALSWKEMILFRSRQIVAQTAEGLAA